MRVYTFDIDIDEIGISNIHRYFEMDMSGYTMEDFHCGMADLIYDRDVPEGFGKGDIG